jgi:hypothetical protein
MGFEGIPGVIADLGRLDSAIDGVTTRANAAGAALRAMNSDFGSPFESAGTSAGGSGAGLSTMVGIPGVGWGESLTPAQKIALGFGVTPGADSAAVAASFKALADKIDKFQGDTNNYWSQLLNKEIPYLTTGATSAASAEGMVSTILKVFLPGMEKELQDPKTPKEMQNIIRELMQFAQSGGLQTDKLTGDLERWLSAHGG